MEVEYNEDVVVYPSVRVEGRTRDEDISLAYDSSVGDIVLTDWLSLDGQGQALQMSIDVDVAREVFLKGLELLDALNEYWNETENE